MNTRLLIQLFAVVGFGTAVVIAYSIIADMICRIRIRIKRRRRLKGLKKPPRAKCSCYYCKYYDEKIRRCKAIEKYMQDDWYCCFASPRKEKDG